MKNFRVEDSGVTCVPAMYVRECTTVSGMPHRSSNFRQIVVWRGGRGGEISEDPDQKLRYQDSLFILGGVRTHIHTDRHASSQSVSQSDSLRFIPSIIQ